MKRGVRFRINRVRHDSILPMPRWIGYRSCGRRLAPQQREPARDQSSHGLPGARLFGELRIVHPLLEFETLGRFTGILGNGFINVSRHPGILARLLRKS